MTRFFLKTGTETVAGPFTGIEIREAALAEVVLPDHEIAAAVEGPWTCAANVGLFSEKGVPLPHPEGTKVPEFQLKGVNDAFEGRYKLRELIDFAVRKILPGTASVQPVGRIDWIPVDHFAILAACLRGDIAQDATNTNSPALSSSPKAQGADRRLRAGSHLSPQAPPVEPNAPSRRPLVSEEDLIVDSQDDIDAILDDHRSQARKDLEERLANKGKKPTPKSKSKLVYMGSAATLFLILGLAWWLMSSPATTTYRSEVIGNWVRIPNSRQGIAFGVSFKEDGTCVVFNSNGDCWSGEFEWSNDADEAASKMVASTSAGDSRVVSQHHRDLVTESDGYIRFTGNTSGKSPMLEDRSIRECFARHDEGYLWIGYRAGMDGNDVSESQSASWVQLWPRNRAPSFRFEVDMQARDLLSRFGVPDEARPLTPSEVQANSDPKSEEPRSLIRYGAEQFTLFADGSVRRFKPGAP